MTTLCVVCGGSVGYTADEDVDVQCGRCTLSQCSGLEATAQARLGAVDVEAVKAARKAHGWTQAIFAFKVRVPTSHVAAFEQGHGPCPQEVHDWFEKQ